jgi:hypothetical protein
MGIFSTSLDILYKIEDKEDNLDVTFRNWTWWYLENIVKVLLPGVLITLFCSVFVSNDVSAIIGMIAVGAPFLFLVFRLQFELKELQKIQQLASIKFASEIIILEPSKKSILSSMFLERPSKSGKYIEIPVYSISDFNILPLQDKWGDEFYALYAICLVEHEDGEIHEELYPISPIVAKIEQLENYYAKISNYYNKMDSETSLNISENE